MDFPDDPAAIYGSRLINSRSTKDASPNEHIDPEISMKNRPNVHIVFLGLGLLSSPAMLYPLVPDKILLSEASSSSHVIFNIARQRGPLGPDTSIWACLLSPNGKICTFDIMCANLEVA